ncbi:MAG TPA: hypothetical protein VJ464_13420 [Blastocatellia bacterium]|nr:hypothetical protein [Blastocatellia bacterium]
MEKEIQTTQEVTEEVQEDTLNLNGGETPETPQEPANQPQEPNPDEGIDYKAKFSESTRENQILQAKLKERESRRELTNQPTETELKAAFPSWEFMSEIEKDISRRQLISERKADLALAAQQKRDEDEKWNNSLEFAISANPDLSGKEREFKEFASKPTHRGAPVEVLVDAFLHKSSTPTSKNTPRQVLNTGTGGPKESVKPKKVSIEESIVIRKTDYKRYKELLDAGLIEEIE